MNILVVSDVPDKRYWDFYRDGMLECYDLILSAGDLPPQYLSYLVTFAKCPLFYVHGNHDDCYEQSPPEGCVCIDGKIVTYKGIRIMGLGGSARYKEGKNQYTEKEMSKRIKRMKLKIKKNKGFDILLAHSPAYGMGDGNDHVHKGFKCFVPLIEEYEPKYFFYGHQHLNYGQNKRQFTNGKTTFVNATKSVEVIYGEKVLSI